ncbi:hypothetical protein BCR35DRAFT_301142 [Leucosporidium creatinivorum]|uniref:Ser-Thr-rich glycosyl-phosphatidyl-inositol-anchored membrane family-domain-containing protein n=1 Tax=Leucosporidium creatinivorum TaxID=106004 RepID=A0A1Y2FXM5_9BASI|nr:hypothetical protein BCR35DRAFT_301142 [Leucosporidium creatinivorum]
MLSQLALLALAAASPAVAQLSVMRATIPGALHQCENTNVVFFQTGSERPLDLLFLPSSSVPDSLRTGTTTIEEAITYNPLQAIDGITTADNAAYDFELQIAEGTVFEVFGFLPDGSGKALSLTRTVMTPLPTATACLTNVQTTIPGVGAAGATTTAAASSAESTTRGSTRTRSSASDAVATSAKSSSAASSSSATSSATSASSTSGSNTDSAAASASTTPSSAGILNKAISGDGMYVWATLLGGLGAAAEFLLF